MDWKPVRDAVVESFALATGLDIKDVQLETDRGAFNSSRGRRLRLDFGQRDASQPEVIYVDDGAGGVIEALLADREVTVSARFFCDDHRTAADNGGWAHELADRLATQLWISPAADVWRAVGLVLASTETVLPNPRVILDNREMSVATLDVIFNLRTCSGPLDETLTADWFDKVELNNRRPRAVYQRDLVALGPWRYLWLGEETDVAGGRIVVPAGGAAVMVGDPPEWVIGTGTVATEDLDQGQLLEGQAIAIALRAPAPLADISVLGRIASGVGWALEGLPSGALRLSALGTGGETSGQLPGILDDTNRVVVLHNSSGTLSIYEGGSSAGAAISGSHLAGAAALVAGALREPTASVSVRLLGQVETSDPDGFRAALVAALGL